MPSQGQTYPEKPGSVRSGESGLASNAALAEVMAAEDGSDGPHRPAGESDGAGPAGTEDRDKGLEKLGHFKHLLTQSRSDAGSIRKGCHYMAYHGFKE